MKYPIILGHRSKDTLKAEVYHKNASYFLLGELRIFIKTMPIMLFHFTAFMAVDLILDTGVIVAGTELFVKIAKFNMGIVLPILLDIIYTNIKGKLKANITTT